LSSQDFQIRLEKWAEREIARKPSSEGRVRDKKAALNALAEHHPDMKSIQSHLEKLYPDPRSKNYTPAEVTLSTIHKAKGLEWPDVLFLDPDLIPSKWAKTPEALTQEENLAYVGVTRAQQTLHFASYDTIHSNDN
jgi:superfamily I DNA/RNA helicase